MNTTEYKNKYNNSTDGLFKANSSKAIGADDIQALVTDTGDNFLNAEDDVLDEDDMASNSATQVPTQQSTKAYVDAAGTALSGSITTVANNLSSHTGNTSNPHNVTKTQVGLGNVDNTSDVNKPVSTATQTAIDTVTTVSVSGAATLDATAYGKLHLLSGTSADYQVDLPTAVGQAGKTIAFKGLVGLTVTVTLDANSTQTIDGDTTRKISSRGILVLQSDGTNFIIVHEVGSWIPWTPVFTGFSADPTNVNARYFRMGNKLDIRVTMSGGTSNATGFTMTLPFNSLVTGNTVLLMFNAGTAVIGRGSLTAASDVLTMFSSATGNWTASGVKALQTVGFSYEKA